MKSLIITLLYIGLACVCGQINHLEYPATSDVYNQSMVHVKQEGHREPLVAITSDLYNHGKVHAKQDDRHLPEYYGNETFCPDVEDIAPCVCTHHNESNAMDLECSAVESEEQLKQIFKADFPLKNFTQFLLYANNNIKVLEAGVFNGVSFEIIHIYYTDLEVVELQALDSCYETATNIYLYNNNITSFPFDELSLFTKLCHFDISGNSLSVIPADAFNDLTALEYLNICCNNADIVGTFQDLPNLWGIDLGYNDITTTIPAQFIKTGSSELSYIDLSGNNIVSVEPGAFGLVDGLIYMRFNSLSTLDEATWRPHLEAGGVLDAAYNPLACGCDIAWLFAENQLLEQVGYNATCTDGEYMYDLDPTIFDLCYIYKLNSELFSLF